MGFFDNILFADERNIRARDSFDQYQRWFESLDKTDQDVDIDLGGIRVRCFGDEKRKQEAWERDWRKNNPDWGPVSAGTSVSGEKPEIWCDLRQDGQGNVVFPMHVIGHEMTHTMRLKDRRIANPDTLIEKRTYRVGPGSAYTRKQE